jgi:hypothetical protein
MVVWQRHTSKSDGNLRSAINASLPAAVSCGTHRKLQQSPATPFIFHTNLWCGNSGALLWDTPARRINLVSVCSRDAASYPLEMADLELATVAGCKRKCVSGSRNVDAIHTHLLLKLLTCCRACIGDTLRRIRSTPSKSNRDSIGGGTPQLGQGGLKPHRWKVSDSKAAL